MLSTNKSVLYTTCSTLQYGSWYTNYMTEMITVAVGSRNQAKNQAVAKSFGRAFATATVATRGYEVASGIAEQPTTDEEAIEGATNRARAALAQLATADYGVGLEGNTVTIAGTMFLHGWVAIVQRQSDQIGIGHSSGVALPPAFKQAIDDGQELGPLVQTLFQDETNAIRHGQGTNGLLTNGLYSREQEFIDATTVALARFVSPELYAAEKDTRA